MHYRRLRAAVALVLACAFGATAAAQETASVKHADPKAVEWYRDAKFGLFVHWGVYSVLGDGEWVMNNRGMTVAEYEKLPAQFNPTNFDAKEWVSMVKDAGVRYVTITSKHHDGFAMFDSKVSDYDIVDRTPYGKDVLKQLADECAAQGVKLFFYYSPLDWHHPDFFPRGGTGRKGGRPEAGDWGKYKAYYQGQIMELLDGRYGMVGGIWLDGCWDRKEADWGLPELYEKIHARSPMTMVGNNHHDKPIPGEDYQLFEQDLPGVNTAGFNKAEVADAMPLETCLTMNGSWGFNAKDKNFKSSTQCLHYLIRAAGHGANLLLNVGPKPDGTIQEEAKERLAEMGRWLRKNGESIYGTRKGPWAPAEWGASTRKGDVVYVHVLKWPVGGKLVLDAPPGGVAGVRGAGGAKVGNRMEGGKLELTIPEGLKDEVDTIVEVTLKKEG